MAEQIRVVCPSCGMSRMANIYHSDDEKAFGTWDESKPFIHVRAIPGGKKSDMLVGTGKYRKTPGKGFPLIASYTLPQAKDTKEYEFYAEKTAEHLVNLMKIFRKNGLISDEELEEIRNVA